MAENIKDDNIYLYLDFGGNLKDDIFEEPINLQIANLHKENPLVQLNERVFKGTFDNAIGTNLFFEMSDNQLQSDVFGRKAPVHLDYVASQNKVLNLVPVKIKPRKPEMQSDQLKIKYNFKWEYNTLLQKWDDGTLELKDLIKVVEVIPSEEDSDEPIEDIKSKVESCKPVQVNAQQKVDEEDECSKRELLEDYQKLKSLAKRPVKRKIKEEIVENCEDKYKQAYELHNLEKQILQPSEAFKTEQFLEINENTLPNCIDIDRCVLYGILKPSTISHHLTESEKNAVLTIENFDNLSLSARYYVINEYVLKLEKYMKNLSEDQLQQKDEYARTPIETLEIYKKLRETLSRRITEIKFGMSVVEEENYMDSENNLVELDLNNVK